MTTDAHTIEAEEPSLDRLMASVRAEHDFGEVAAC